MDKIEIEESEKESEIDNDNEMDDIDKTFQINSQKDETKMNNFVLKTDWSIKDWLDLIEGKINYVK